MQKIEKVFNPDWIQWIQTNVNAGRDKDGIFKILLDEGYAFDAIQQQMNYTPSVPLENLVNPFAQAAKASKASMHGMSLDTSKVFIPNAVRLNTDKAEIYTIHDFLNQAECAFVIALIRAQNQPSTLSSYEADASFRTSRTCNLEGIGGAEMKAIDDRICKVLGINPSYSEGIQGQYYEVGQEFKAHTDYFEANEIGRHGGQMGQRTFTFMVYLNEVEEGGETDFVRLGAAFKPQVGMAVVWNNLHADGSPNEDTMHHARPVTKGHKAIITKWFRSGSKRRPAPPMYSKEPNELIPNYTHIGFQKSKVPEHLFEKILKFYRENEFNQVNEYVEGDFIVNAVNRKQAISTMIELSETLRMEIHDALRPLMEAWCGKSLDPTYVYGVRAYKDQAVLKSHRDRIETHIISAIINVDQVARKNWPLVIDDNLYREHHVLLQPGEMVFYEGARLKHGRPIPFEGSVFANIFCHFKPSDYLPPR
jgi:prolyl 4-hydroxylase